jgi:hypothetical protein
VAMFRGRPYECSISVSMAATGVPFYLWFRRRNVATASA